GSGVCGDQGGEDGRARTGGGGRSAGACLSLSSRVMSLHVPERFRHKQMSVDHNHGNNGFFTMASPTSPGWLLFVLATDGQTEDDDSPPGDWGWEHVSVSCRRPESKPPHNSGRVPSWAEMCWIKDLFWDADDTVVQFHPKRSEYVNEHPACLHLWRKVGTEFELPPTCLVGTRTP